MKAKISLNDMSQLLNISKYTLRYYDKIGLIAPCFDNNGYRYYTFDHYYILSTIKLLRQMDVPIKNIKRSLNDDNLDDFTDLLYRSKEHIDLEINRMTQISNLLENKIKTADHEKLFENKWFIKKFEERKFYFIGKMDLTNGNDLSEFKTLLDQGHSDFLLESNLMTKYSIHDLKRVLEEDIVEIYIEYHDEINISNKILVIPSETCIVYYYKGTEANIYDSLTSIMSDITSKGYIIKDHIYEVLRPSHLITSSKKAFFTEFNIPIIRRSKNS